MVATYHLVAPLSKVAPLIKPTFPSLSTWNSVSPPFEAPVSFLSVGLILFFPSRGLRLYNRRRKSHFDLEPRSRLIFLLLLFIFSLRVLFPSLFLTQVTYHSFVFPKYKCGEFGHGSRCGFPSRTLPLIHVTLRVRASSRPFQ